LPAGDARAAVGTAADGSRAARARQVAHRGRAERVESCIRTEHARISKGAGRERAGSKVYAGEGRVRWLWGMDLGEMRTEHLVALQDVRRHLRTTVSRNKPETRKFELRRNRQRFGSEEGDCEGGSYDRRVRWVGGYLRRARAAVGVWVGG
jgi:hypothetical protein